MNDSTTDVPLGHPCISYEKSINPRAAQSRLEEEEDQKKNKGQRNRRGGSVGENGIDLFLMLLTYSCPGKMLSARETYGCYGQRELRKGG